MVGGIIFLPLSPLSCTSQCLTVSRRHVEIDLKLYACISEECVEPPQLFARFDEWKRHMDAEHSHNWIQEIHRPLNWCCEIDHEKKSGSPRKAHSKNMFETNTQIMLNSRSWNH